MNALLGGIIGGALEQGGKAAYRSMAEDAELERKMTLEDHRSKIEEDRAMRLEAIRGQREDKNYVRQRADTVLDKGEERTYQLGRDKSQAELQAERDGRLHKQTTDLHILDQAARAKEAALQRGATIEGARIQAGASRAGQGTLQTADDGNVYRILDGKSTLVTDDKGNPFKSQKGLSAETLEKAKVWTTAASDKDQTPEYRESARQMALSILNGGKAPAAGAPGAQPTPAPEMLNQLKSVLRGKDAEKADRAKASFAASYGQPALDAFLKSNPPAPAAPPPPPPGAIPSAMPPMGDAADNPNAIIARESQATERGRRAALMTPDLAARTGAGAAARILKEIGKELDPEVRDILEKRARDR